MDNLYQELAVAYVRGTLPDTGHCRNAEEVLALGRAAGLKLHRFKRTMELPRVRAVLGILHNIAPDSLLDIGTGRGVFLWPLLDAFSDLEVTVVERDKRRREHLDAVKRGGIERLNVLGSDACALPFVDRTFDIVTVLEVLEHQKNPAVLAQEAIRLAQHFVIVSVPSKADNNPEHIQLFSGETLKALLLETGATRVNIDYVLNHIIAVARIGA